MKELLRKYKIYKLLNIPLSDEMATIVFIHNKLNSMVENRNHPDYIFYYIEDNLHMRLSKDTNNCYCRCENFVDILIDKYFLANHDISEYMKYMVEQYFKCEIECIIPIRGWY